MDLVFVCDGSYKELPGVPGVATYGWVLRAGQVTHTDRGIVCWGRGAHNLVAEVGAVLSVLQWVRAVHLPPACRITVRTDCSCVADRLTGRMRGRPKRGLIMLYAASNRLQAAIRRMGHEVRFEHVPRREVSQAHTLCRSVYRQLGRRAIPQRVTTFLSRKPRVSDRLVDLLWRQAGLEQVILPPA